MATVDELKRKLKFEDLVKGFRQVGLTAGDTVLVQSSFIPLRKAQGGPRTVIEALLAVLAPEGTLIMPTFNWADFGEKKFYSQRTTKPQTGILTELFMNWEGCQRIYHPFHGFSLVGKLAQELAQKVKNRSSFEASSLFGKLHRMNAKLMLLGVDYRQGFSFFHYVEESVGVPYRKFLTLRGKMEKLDGTIHDIEIPYYGRASLSEEYNLDKIAPILEEDCSVVVTGSIGMCPVKVVRAKEAYDLLATALKKNPNLVCIKRFDS